MIAFIIGGVIVLALFIGCLVAAANDIGRDL